jgi:hypothetical protein
VTSRRASYVAGPNVSFAMAISVVGRLCRSILQRRIQEKYPGLNSLQGIWVKDVAMT